MQSKSFLQVFRCGLWCVLLSQALAAQTSATFGDVIQLGGTPSDVVLDESRARLYLVNSPASRVDVYDYAGQTLLGSIGVGQLPLSAAMSMDNAYLYVSNHDDSTLSVIGLNGADFGTVISTVSLPAKPQGVEVGFDGRVLICTDGSGTTSTSNTLLIYDGTQATGAQVLAVAFPPAPSTPPSLANLTARNSSFYGKLQRTSDGKLIVGVSTITVSGNGSNVVYLYEVASGTVLQARTVVGQSPTLAVAPDGASFMAGFTLFDTATLNIIGRQSLANAPFVITLPGSTTPATIQTGASGANVGGSVFAPAGNSLYSAFNTASTASATVANTLLISDPRSLAISLGINLPESVIAKMVVTSDGNDAWASSTSGIIHLPLGKLYSDYPILMPETNVVFLPQDDCNAGVVQAKVKINNIGGGTLTFAVPNTIPASLVLSDSSGVAPGTLTFTMDPGRSGVVRTPGTNLYTFTTTSTVNAASLGTAMNIQLSSPNAINVSPIIRVYMNSRDSTMRGVIYPLPTGPNSTAAAYEGLQDVVLDESRNRVYITNSAYNRIEVFDTQKTAFQTPIPVGQLPHQMAMGLDGSTLYVANTGGETISVVDLDQQLVTGSIQFPPIPRQASAAIVSVQSMAMGLSGLQLVLSDGTLWKVIGNQAIPRVGTSVTGVATNGTQTPLSTPTRMLGSDDGTSLLVLGNTGTAYLYDGLSDAYTTSNRLFGNNSAAIIGYYGALGVGANTSFLLANGLVMNRSLSPIGGATSPGQLSIVPPIGPGAPGGVGVTSTGLRNVAAVAPVGTSAFLRMTTPVRTNLTTATGDDVHTTLEAVDVNTGATALAARMPENPVLSEFAGARTATTARQMVVDSNGTVYALTLSGLSVLPLTPTNSTTQPQIATSGGVTNATVVTNPLKPGSFVSIKGTNLASTATASTLPTPTLLGGSCVLVESIAIPLLSTSPGLISAQIPANMPPGVKVLQVRSLATAQQSQRVVVTIQKP
jgi:DNA-binding beta-propeller fold protein YncE